MWPVCPVLGIARFHSGSGCGAPPRTSATDWRFHASSSPLGDPVVPSGPRDRNRARQLERAPRGAAGHRGRPGAPRVQQRGFAPRRQQRRRHAPHVQRRDRAQREHLVRVRQQHGRPRREQHRHRVPPRARHPVRGDRRELRRAGGVRQRLAQREGRWRSARHGPLGEPDRDAEGDGARVRADERAPGGRVIEAASSEFAQASQGSGGRWAPRSTWCRSRGPSPKKS